jgi:hypothetical protein
MKKHLMSVFVIFTIVMSLQAQSITLQLLPASPADKNFRVGGMAGFSVTAPPSDTVWSEDSIPPGAVATGENENWTWVSANPTPFSGALAHQSVIAAGMHQHYFYWASPLTVNAGDALIAYVYLDPVNLPSQVMLQWNDGTWEHRAYWGANQLGWGTNGTSSRYNMGALPPAGQWVRLEVPASLVGLEGHTLNGMAFSLSGGRATWDHAGKSGAPAPPSDIVWSEDNVPPGAVATGENENWNWISSNPSPYSGSLAHQSVIAAGMHQHYFYWASPLTVNAGDVMVAYVYLDPANMPSEVMLQWNDGTWEHRAYWGANQLGWGTTGTNSRYYMGALPTAGQWVRLEVPASLVGLEGITISGMAFSLSGGRATWDHAGKSSAYASDQYRMYATTSLPRGRWTSDGLNMRDYFAESLDPNNPIHTEIGNCSVQNDPRTWNPRCIDNVVLLTKNITCASDNPTLACQNTVYWNGYPGRSNMSIFPTRPPIDDKGFGWPSNNSWGVKGFNTIVNKDIINNAQTMPPATGVATQCHPSNPGDFATGAANSEATQVKFPDGTSRWFMAYNNQIHHEQPNGGFNGEDLWRVQWAYSNDGKTWTPESRPLIMDSSERSGNCWQGILVTDMFVDTDTTDPNNPKPYFYIAFTIVLTDQVWLLRSPVVQSSVPGYDTNYGWEVRGSVDPLTGKNRWIRIPPSQLGTQIDFYSLGAQSVAPTHFINNYGGLVKQTVFGRVFTSSQPNSQSKYLMLTVDKNGTAAGSNDILELWATDDLSKPFVYQSDVTNSALGPFGGYGFEVSFVHYPDNNPNTPRIFDNEFELWFSDSVPCEGLANCNPSSPPGYRNQSAFTVSRRRARLSGSIYGP